MSKDKVVVKGEHFLECNSELVIQGHLSRGKGNKTKAKSTYNIVLTS